MNYPLKKRRGRPPKYLSVWQHQYSNSNSSNNNNNNNNNNGCSVNHVRQTVVCRTADMDRVGCLEPVDDDNTKSNDNSKSNDNNGNNSGTNNNNNNNNYNDDDGRPESDIQVDGVNDGLSEARWPSRTDGDPDRREGHHRDRCTARRPPGVVDSEPDTNRAEGAMSRQTATPDGPSSTSDENQSHRKPAGTDPESELTDSAKSDRKTTDRFRASGTTRSGVETGPETVRAESRPPMKKRPGRPPGSTKKARTAFVPLPCERTNGDGDEYSLRRFFEAGGRDYHEYLEWLKNKRSAERQPPQPPPQLPPQLPVMVSPFCQLPMAAGDVRMMTPQRFAFPAPPVYRPPVALPSGVLHPTPADREGRPETGGSSLAPGIVGQQPAPRQAAAYDYKSFRCKPKCPNADSPTQLPADAGVLDLSAKRVRKDSDSEKENACLDMSVNKRTKHGKDDVGRKELASRTLTTDKQTLEMDGKHVTDDLVESSTGCDVTTTWSVDQVASFVARVPECHVYAEVFRNQRIDGTTLPHLSDDHLLNHVGMKLGHMIHLRLALSRLKNEK